jgi:hypothetical protein
MKMSQPSPDSGTPIESGSVSVEDAITFMGDDDVEQKEVIELDEKPAKKDKAAADDDSDDSEKSDDDSEEDKSVEDELEEELDEEIKDPDDELELVTPVRRKEILAKYPNLFKDFPYLQKAYYREQKYSELLPTIEDAQIAVDRSQLLDKYESEIMGGSTESLLSTVRDGDREAFAKVVDNYLPTLFKVDEGAYYHTIGNIIKHTIISMVQDGKSNDSDDLIHAAEAINEYVFGTKKFTPPGKLAKTEDNTENKSKADEVSERERQFMERQFESAKTTVTTKIDNVLKSTVDKNIDPNQSMTDYVRRTATREVLELLDTSIESDKRFRAIYDRLWEKAANDNFSSESMDRIKSAYLSKAKTLLPDFIKKARNEALKGLTKRANNDSDTKDKKGPLPVGKTRSAASSSNSGKTDNRSNAKQPVPRGMSSLDYLMSD